MKSTIVACLLAAGVTVFGLVYRTGVASGADSYGYVSQADLWLKGNLHVSQPFARELPWPDAGLTAAPLGYLPAASDPTGAIVPWYSPGLALLMAAAKVIGGYPAVYWVVPLLGGLLVLSIFGIGRHFGGPLVGLASAFLCAFSPIVLFMVLWPMSDIATAAFWAASSWAVLGASRRRAFAGGLLTAMAIVIRPNLVGVGMMIGVWTILRDVRRGSPWWRVDRAAMFAAGSLPGIAFVMAFNRALYGSAFVSGYGSLESVLHLANFPTNVARYSEWLFTSETPLIAIGLLAIVLPIARVWGHRDRAFDAALFSLIAIGTLSCYLFFMPLDEWWYLRFLMPMWPGLFVGLSVFLPGLFGLIGRAGRVRMAVAAIVIVGIGAHGVLFAREKRITRSLQGERRFITAAELVRANTDPNSAIFSFVHSGSVRFYGERMTLRYDHMAPEWLDRGVAWLSQHGAHSYLLVEDWELAQWKERFGRTSALGRMDMAVVFELQWPTHLWLFDLTRPATKTWPVIVGFGAPPVPRTVPPAPPPVFALMPSSR